MAVAIGLVDAPRFPDMADLEAAEDVGHQLEMILVRMAEDQMVDARKAGTHGFDIGDDTVFVAVVEIILASGIIEQREIAALDEYGEPGADVDHMHLVSRAGQGFARRGAADHQRPCLADIAMRAVGQLDAVPARSEEHTSELQSLMRNSY